MRAIADGLLIFLKYGGTDMAAEHDVIYAGQPDNTPISHEDVATLEALGWRRDDGACNCASYGERHDNWCSAWRHFV